MAICYIVGAGEFYGSFTPNEEDLVIAADGGYDSLKERNIRCDLLVGDLDSIKNLPFNTKTVTFPKKKDETDLHLAYLEGKKRGYDNFHIYGGVGGRSDHTFASYSLLSYIAKENGKPILFDKNCIVTAINDNGITTSGKRGAGFSVFAFGADAEGVSITGAGYEVQDALLTPHFPLGVSNYILGGPLEISVKHGTLLVFFEI